MIDEAILNDISIDDISAISLPYPVIQGIARELLTLRKLAEDMELTQEDTRWIEGNAERKRALTAYRAEYLKKEENHAKD